MAAGKYKTRHIIASLIIWIVWLFSSLKMYFYYLDYASAQRMVEKVNKLGIDDFDILYIYEKVEKKAKINMIITTIVVIIATLIFVRYIIKTRKEKKKTEFQIETKINQIGKS